MPTVRVDKDECIACASCYQLCPKVFERESDGKARVARSLIVRNEPSFTIGKIGPEYIECARLAEGACPASAIAVEE
ncbi:MAG: ferredoxin [Candidatus Bathyarchaeia archaeon]